MKKILFSMLTLWLCSCSRSPDKIFTAIFDEIPESVEILRGQDQLLFDCCLWLQFKISESDFNSIFEAYTKEKLDYKKWSSVLPPEIDWWNPNKFEKEGIYFEKTSKDKRLIQGIYTNEKKNEVFYVNWSN